MRLMQNFSNPETGELFYEPVNLKLLSLIKRASAWVRIWVWGLCPACNSDAPKIDNCKVCHWDTKAPFTKKKKKHHYWNKWKLLNHKK